MGNFYNQLTPEEQGSVLSAVAGLKLNAKQGKAITRKEINAAFLQATGKTLSLEYMRDPSVVQLMSMVSPAKSYTGVYSANQPKTSTGAYPSTSITDRNLAARGLPVPKTSTYVPGQTRYSAGFTANSRYGR